MATSFPITLVELRRIALRRLFCLATAAPVLPAVCLATEPNLTARVPVETVRLANGMRLLLVERPGVTTVAAGWVVEVGSADEEPGQTGMSHLLEHLMFKGSRTIGTRDFDSEKILLEREAALLSELRQLRAGLSGAASRQRSKLEKQIAGTEEELSRTRDAARSLARLGELTLLYSQVGAVGLNAHTLRDLTFYYVTVPAERLETWFWLESDRLLEPVFREFDNELQVIREERRLRIESNPTGAADETLRAEFWGGHPYAWDPQGTPEDLDRLTRHSAQEFFERHYVPERITATLVGGFDSERVRALAEKYFGRLPRGNPEPESRRAAPFTEDREGERRISLDCRCPSQVRVLYPSAAFGHADSRTLEVLAAVLNGRAGRLYRSMVLGQEIAFSASALQSQLRQAGYFTFRAETKGQASPEDLLAAWDLEVAELQTELVTTEELVRAQNRSTADSFRRLKDPASLLTQLLVYQGMGDWREVDTWPRQMLRVDVDQVRAAARHYLQPSRRSVAFFRRTDGEESRSPSARIPASGGRQ